MSLEGHRRSPNRCYFTIGVPPKTTEESCVDTEDEDLFGGFTYRSFPFESGLSDFLLSIFMS